MKSVLVKFRDRTFNNLTLICALSLCLVACGGQDSVDHNSNDTAGPVIKLNYYDDPATPENEADSYIAIAVVETDSGPQYIPESKINYITPETINHYFGSYGLEYIKNDDKAWAGVWLELDTAIDASNGQILTAKIHSTKPRTITLKLDVAEIEVTASHSGKGHEILEFEFSGGIPVAQDKIVFISDNGTNGKGGADWTIYIDDLSQKLSSEETTSTLLVNFDDLTKNYIVGDFDGGVATISESIDTDPQQLNGRIIGYHETRILGEEYEDLGAVANDIYSGYIPKGEIVSEGTIDKDNKDTQIITYIATDRNKNESRLSRHVTPIDITAPSIIFDDPNTLDVETRDVIINVGDVYEERYVSAYDNIANNIDQTKYRKVLQEIVFDDITETYIPETASEIKTDKVAHFTIEHSYSDNSGNTRIVKQNIFIRNNFESEKAVFKNGSVGAAWTEGIWAYDLDLEGDTCRESRDCPNIDWAIFTEPGRSNVLQITHNDYKDADAGLIISSPVGIDLRGPRGDKSVDKTGLLELDIKRVSGSDPYVDIWADCGYPCAGGASRQGPFVTGEWTKIYIPIHEIMEGPTSSLDLSIVRAGLLFKAPSARDAVYRIDNVRWLCESTCEGDNTPHVPFDWKNTLQHIEDGYTDTPTTYPGYTLVWNDEFEGNVINPKHWDYDVGTGDNGWGNGELQYYRPENATLENGMLAIEAQKHQPKIQIQEDNGNVRKDIAYTSAKLKTEDKFEFRYGRVDVRAVAAKGRGLWSAIWMLGANINEVVDPNTIPPKVLGWPRSGEIDILDTIGGTRDGLPQESMLVNNMYWNATGASPDAPTSIGSINTNGRAEYWLNEPTLNEEPDYVRAFPWNLDDLPDWMAGPSLAVDNPNTDRVETEIRPLLLTGCEGGFCIDTDVTPNEHKIPSDVDNIPDWITNDVQANSDWETWKDNGGSTETFSNTFHVFSLIWDENTIQFLVDDEPTMEVEIIGFLEEHYRKTFYLILNVAIGGNWPKSPKDSTAFNAGMFVDYVRVYQLDSDGDGTADLDWDGDTKLDAFPNDENESMDTDGDGIGNNADQDDDGDGVNDNEDAFPLDPSETVDTDGDGTGDNADTKPSDPNVQ